MSTRELSPEDMPTYMAPGQVTNQGKLALTREAVEMEQELIQVFAMPGWKHLVTMFGLKERETSTKLTARAGTKDLDEVYALRERLELIRWLLGLEDATKLKLAENQEALERAGGN